MMLRTATIVTLLSAASIAATGHASASQFKEFEDNCGAAPFAPDVKMDPSITDQKVTELRKDILQFIKSSDQFQDCMNRMLEAGPTFKKEDDTQEKRIAIATKFEREAVKIIDENQSEKERVGNDFNKLIELRKKGAAPK